MPLLLGCCCHRCRHGAIARLPLLQVSCKCAEAAVQKGGAARYCFGSVFNLGQGARGGCMRCATIRRKKKICGHRPQQRSFCRGATLLLHTRIWFVSNTKTRHFIRPNWPQNTQRPRPTASVVVCVCVLYTCHTSFPSPNPATTTITIVHHRLHCGGDKWLQHSGSRAIASQWRQRGQQQPSNSGNARQSFP